MSTPAEFAFRRDRRFKLAGIRVYDHLRERLDHSDARPVKLWVLCDGKIGAGVDREAAIKALNDLVAFGYLIEHARGYANVRRFTLAWSVASSREVPTDSAA